MEDKPKKKININAIGKASSERLAVCLSADLADAIIRERELQHLDFTSWDDLKHRIHGLGEKKIQKLKDNGFVIEETGKTVRSAAAEAGGGGSSHTKGGKEKGDDELASLPSIRTDVNCLRDQTWRHRNDKDMYTEKTKNYFKKHTEEKTEVDHVW